MYFERNGAFCTVRLIYEKKYFFANDQRDYDFNDTKVWPCGRFCLCGIYACGILPTPCKFNMGLPPS